MQESVNCNWCDECIPVASGLGHVIGDNVIDTTCSIGLLTGNPPFNQALTKVIAEANKPAYTTYAVQTISGGPGTVQRSPQGDYYRIWDPATFEITTPADPVDIITGVWVQWSDLESGPAIFAGRLRKKVTMHLAGQAISVVARYSFSRRLMILDVQS